MTGDTAQSMGNGGMTQTMGGMTQTMGQATSRAVSMERPTRKFTMLSRTADNLFWMARYMERAEFLARTIEAAQRLSALPTAYNEHGTEWEDRKSTRLNSSHSGESRMPSSA